MNTEKKNERKIKKKREDFHNRKLEIRNDIIWKSYY